MNSSHLCIPIAHPTSFDDICEGKKELFLGIINNSLTPRQSENSDNVTCEIVLRKDDPNEFTFSKHTISHVMRFTDYLRITRCFPVINFKVNILQNQWVFGL